MSLLVICFEIIMEISLNKGDWFKFTTGPHADLPALVTERRNFKDGRVVMCYELVGDGRSEALKRDVAYELAACTTDERFRDAQKLEKCVSWN